MESGDVFYTPDLPLGSLRDVMGLRYWPIDRDIQWATERRAGDQHAAGGGVRERLWWVVEWSCTEMESRNVFYTPGLLLGSLRDVMGLRY